MRVLKRPQSAEPRYAPGPAPIHGVPAPRDLQWSTVVLEKPRTRWRLAGLGLLLILVAGAWAAYTWANRPQVAVLGTSQVRPPATAPSQQLQDIVTGLYATKLPEVFGIRERQDQVDKSVLSRLVATQTTDGSGQIAIMVRTLPDGGLGQSSDIRHRQLQSEQYAQESFDWLPAGATAYRANGSYELGVFMAHGQQYASVVLINTKNAPAYDAWMRTVIENWRWLP